MSRSLGARSQEVPDLPVFYQDREWTVVRRSGFLERIGHNLVERAVTRLSELKKEGHFEMVLNTAQKPLPFSPERVRFRRQSWRTNGAYDNLTPCTRFLPEERKLVSVERAAELCGFNWEEFLVRAAAFHKHFELEGEPDELSTWAGYNIRRFHAKFGTYNEHKLLKGLFWAAAKSSSFAVLKDIGVVSISPVQAASKKELRRALDKIFVALNVGHPEDAGVAVPSLWRGFIMWGWLVTSVVLVTVGAAIGWSDIQLGSKDHIELLVFVAISLPALTEYISEEPSVIKHAIRGTRVLWKNSQVRDYFNLSEFDYAVMALLPTEIWLVSDRTASFLQQGGHRGLQDDVFVTNTVALGKVGIYVGYSMARREWDMHNVTIVSGSDNSISLGREEADELYIAGQCDVRAVA